MPVKMSSVTADTYSTYGLDSLKETRVILVATVLAIKLHTRNKHLLVHITEAATSITSSTTHYSLLVAICFLASFEIPNT